MATVQAVFDEKQKEADLAFQVGPEDGLLSVAAKKVFGCRCWRFLFRCTVPLVLKIQGKWQFSGEESQANTLIRRAIDWHIILMGALLATGYIAVVLGSYADLDWIGIVVISICCLFSIYRLGEILSVFVQLHLKSVYQSDAATRAVLNTFWHYLEFAIAFATFYAAVAKCTGDPFTTCDKVSLLSSPFNPLYFSFVTITTLGYGDFAPQTWQGKALVPLEVFLGLFLIVMVVQRAISAGMNSTKNGEKR
jgi:hypothetical protein